MLYDASTSRTNRIGRRMIYVFRNNTIEPFFGVNYIFSGYDDISIIPDAESYIWWYQVPLKYNILQLADEVRMYQSKVGYIVQNISTTKTFYIFSILATALPKIELNNHVLEDAIIDFNKYIYQLSLQYTNVKIVDIYDFVGKYSSNELIDLKYYFTAQIPYNPQLVRAFRVWWSRQQQAIMLQRKKCLVLDLDNTLWFGILGEDGVEGIQMSGDYPGKAFYIWQEGIKELQRSGVMLAICSKNNMADVEEVWQKRADMILQKSDFVAMRINWQDKATNLQELAKELNISVDSFVFVDDSPSERELIKQQLPMVAVPDFPEQPYQLPNLYQQLVENYFSVYVLTDEDREKTQQYAANVRRKEAEVSFTNLDDFIASLNIRLQIRPVDEILLPRVAQMTQKTNQFNLTTRRYSEQDLNIMLSKGCEIWTLSVSDKFGDSGVTGVIILTNEGWIDTLLLSCRVLGKGIEDVFLKYVLKRTKHAILKASYIKTSKNSLVESFYDKMGFDLLSSDETIKYYSIVPSNANLSLNNLYTIN